MKTIVITGGNRGLGLAQTNKFLQTGHRVVVVARSRGELESLANPALEFVEHDLGERLAQFGLSNSGWPEEQK